MNIVKLQDIKLIHRNALHSYILTMRKQKEKLRKQFHLPFNENNKILRYLSKETKELYTCWCVAKPIQYCKVKKK